MKKVVLVLVGALVVASAGLEASDNFGCGSSENVTACKFTAEDTCAPSGNCPEPTVRAFNKSGPRVSAISYRSNYDPAFQGARPEKITAFRLGRIYARDNGFGGAVQIVPFGGQTTNAKALAEYLMPFGKSELVVRGGSGVTPTNADIDAKAFNIFTTSADTSFESRICFRPQQTTAGLGFTWRQKLCANEEERGFYFALSAPITHVTNKLNFKEEVITDGGTADTTEGLFYAQPNMTSAFQQERFLAGRIECNPNNKGSSVTRLGDLDLRIGYGWNREDMYHFESYIGVLAPTGNSVKGCSIFEPVVGHDKHVGLLFGSAAGFQLWENVEKGYSIRTELAIHSIFLGTNTQRRAIDVRDSPWSRYLPVYCNQAAAEAAFNASGGGLANQGGSMYTSGINVFTPELRVEGRFRRRYNSAWLLRTEHMEVEAGFNFFAVDAERITLKEEWSGQYAFLHAAAQSDVLSAISGNAAPGATTRFRKINNDALDTVAASDLAEVSAAYQQNIIRAEDLDLYSAGAPCTTQYGFYGSFSYRWDEIEYPTALSAGGSFEFASDNSGFDRWLAWGKLAVSY